jgi:hypothetical protein
MGRVIAAERHYARRIRRRAIDNAALRLYHREYRVRLLRYCLSGSLGTMLTAPLIYSMIVPFALLDLWVAIYQAVCFRAWGIATVRRRDYIAVDRHKLAYLNAVEKLNCLFCSYANGVIGYVREVAARTEQYWCPIHHARRTRQPHEHARAFLPYGDAAGYRAGLRSLRAALRK